MHRRSARADFFDASALVKVVTTEPGSDVVREYFYSRPTKYTTSFCFYEALNVLKGKWKYRNELTVDEYYEAARHLTAWHGAWSKEVNDPDFSDPIIFADTRRLTERFQLDLSDAFQIMSVKYGYFSVLVNDSATVLVTADNELAAAAKSEGLRVWNVLLEPPPA
jgi:predicted nucleic acid-binding protein